MPRAGKSQGGNASNPYQFTTYSDLASTMNESSADLGGKPQVIVGRRGLYKKEGIKLFETVILIDPVYPDIIYTELGGRGTP